MEQTPEDIMRGALEAIASLDGQCLLGSDSPPMDPGGARLHEHGSAAAFAQAASIAQSALNRCSPAPGTGGGEG